MHEIKTFYELANDKSTPPPAIIDDGVLLDKTILTIIGEAKARKTFLALNLSTALACSKSFGGFNITKKSRVLHLSAEGGYYPTRDRIQNMVQNELEENLKDIFFMHSMNLSIDNDDNFTEIKSIIEEIKPEVVVFDPLIRFHSQDENSSTAMNVVFKRFHELIKQYNISIIIVHHTGKNTSLGGRGSSLIRGEYDSCITIKKKGDVTNMSFDMRHVDSPSPRNLKFNSETLWFEESTANNKVVEYLIENGSSSKSTIVNHWVSSNTCSQGHGYRLISRAINNGVVIEDEDGTLGVVEEN